VLQLGSMAALLPLLGARFEAAGLDGLTIGALMATLPAGRLLAAPLWAFLADRYRLAGAVLRVASVGSALAGMLLARSQDVGVLAMAMFTFSAIRAPIGAVLDAFVLQELTAAGRPASDYGKVRLWGSLGFLVGVCLASLSAKTVLPPHLLADATLLGAAAVSFTFPWGGEGGPAPILPALRTLGRERFLVPLLLTGALQAMSMSVYDTFYSVHIRALGLPDLTVGASICVGVIAEMTLMANARHMMIRIGASRALFVAALSGIPRWILTATLHDPALLVATQAIHGIGFGAFWVGGVHRIQQAAPREISASAQSLWAAGTYGLGALVGAGLAGWARHSLGSQGIFELLTVVAVAASGSAWWLLRVDGAALDAAQGQANETSSTS